MEGEVAFQLLGMLLQASKLRLEKETRLKFLELENRHDDVRIGAREHVRSLQGKEMAAFRTRSFIDIGALHRTCGVRTTFLA